MLERQSVPFPAVPKKISVVPQLLRTGIGLLLGRKGLRRSYGRKPKGIYRNEIDARASNFAIEGV